MIDLIARSLGIQWKKSQWDYLQALDGRGEQVTRTCLYYKTGEGKSITALAGLKLQGYTRAVVIAPPVTHKGWQLLGFRMGMELTCMSHAMFRQPKTKLSRDVPIVADEFHLFGGHTGKGFTKFEKMVQGLQASVVLCSATPNYNDAERCYCVERVLHPGRTKGGYINWIYRNCETEENPFGREPSVTGFRDYDSAVEYLADMPDVFHVPDNATYDIVDYEIADLASEHLIKYGFDNRRDRVVASGMEKKHAIKREQLTDSGPLRAKPHVWDALVYLAGISPTPMLVFSNSKYVAQALSNTALREGVRHTVVSGDTNPKDKDQFIERFKDGDYDMLIGTATLATGLDGLDKMCDMLVIVDDTEDDSLRRQLIGRILPRGMDSEDKPKHIYRLKPV